jgi:cytochrome P450
MADLHARFGPVVRIAPNELDFTDPRAWSDIYARRSKEVLELPQNLDFYDVTGGETLSFLTYEREQHDAVRKVLSNGFSERAMRAQERDISGCVDLLIQKLSAWCNENEGQAVNMRDWIAFTTFDVLGLLTFGSDFGCLRGSEYHPWIKLIIGSVKDMAMAHILKGLGILKLAMIILEPLGVGSHARRTHMELTETKTRQRITMGKGRRDLLESLIQSGMSFDELKQNSGLLVIAGSETTATLLTGAVYFLTSRPDVLEKLKREVRDRFATEDDITLTSVNSLSYMLAVLNECARCYPPTPISSPRTVPQGGRQIAGSFVPQGAVVGVSQWAMYHDPTLFTNPHIFAPDRFTGESPGLFGEDRLDAIKPFLTGPRSCLGQNLAHAEMRLILARLVWRFDMVLSSDSSKWMDKQRSYLLWEKPELNIALAHAKR